MSNTDNIYFEDIKEYFDKNKIPKFRYKQLEDAIFKNSIVSFDDITNFPKNLREELSQKFKINQLILVESHKAGDTVKFVFKTEDNNYVESVLMLHNDGRRTVCVSCQVFCAVGCTFCATGANMYKRSLTKREIIEQVLFISRYLKQSDEKVTNVVFMGMGEPFLNYENVVNSIKILNDEKKFNIGARHITVSTSGIIPKIYEFTDLGLQVRLAISLHAPNDELRSKLMPINKKYPLADLMKACDYFSEKKNKRVSYEYVLIKDINDSETEARELVELLKGRLAHVNLLIYNPHEFSKHEKPQIEKVRAFKKILDENNIECSIRKSMGDDISGACGQLSGKREGNSE